MTQQRWAEPTAGEIVWSHFPDQIHPRPKPRPVLILAVFDDNAPQFDVRVAYGTSERTTSLHRGEFSILRDRNAAAYGAAGLSYDTKFDLRQVLDLSTGPSGSPFLRLPRMVKRQNSEHCIHRWCAPWKQHSVLPKSAN